MATIATNRRVSSDKLFSKTFSQSQKIYQILSSHETPLSSFYRNIITSAHNVNKQSYFEKNNKNLKNIHREFNIKLDMEAEDKNNSNNNNKNNKNNNEMHTNKNGFSFREKQFLDKKYINAYIKTEPCCVSRKNESDLWEEYKQNNEKPKKKSRINKIYSMQPTINNHVKSKLDGKNKNGSNTVTTEEEFESEEISEGNINIDDINRIKKLEISEGIIYGKGGIPKSKSQFSYNFENLEQENKENIDKTQNFNIVTKKKKKSLKKKLLRRLKI